MFAFAADSLTFSRLIAAAVLIWLGFRGPGSLPVAVLVGVVAWTTDQLDGWAARHATTPTHLAPYDFAIDTVLYAATLAYMTLVGFLPLVPVLIFAFLALVAGSIWRHKAVQVLCVRLIDVAAVVVIFRVLPQVGFLLLIWLAVLAVIYRRRLMQRVPDWFSELARLFWPQHRA